MTRRLFQVATGVSAGLVAVTVLLWLASFFVTPWKHRISLSPDVHVGVWRGFRGDFPGRLVVFNDAEYGPYRGSMIGFVDENGQLHPPLEKRTGWDAPGLYYRCFRWPDGGTLWTLMVSLWYPLLLFAVLPAVWLAKRAAGRSSVTGGWHPTPFSILGIGGR